MSSHSRWCLASCDAARLFKRLPKIQGKAAAEEVVGEPNAFSKPINAEALASLEEAGDELLMGLHSRKVFAAGDAEAAQNELDRVIEVYKKAAPNFGSVGRDQHPGRPGDLQLPPEHRKRIANHQHARKTKQRNQATHTGRNTDSK